MPRASSVSTSLRPGPGCGEGRLVLEVVVTLGELIEELEKRDPAQVLPLGFAKPHSYRGYYERLAFEPALNVTVGTMLADAHKALGTTFTGYKGGRYTMGPYSNVHLAYYGDCGEEIGPTLLALLLGDSRETVATRTVRP